MALKQEQVVFLGALALLGWWVKGDLAEDAGGRSRRAADPPPFQALAVPDVSRALPLEARDPDLARDLFKPPKDTAPLPPLPLQLPPLEPLAALAPPGLVGPGPRHYSRLLREEVVVSSAPTLFDQELMVDPADAGDTLDGVGDDDLPDELLSADERAERVAAWKRLYDWIEPTAGGGLLFGSIRNKDRYRLTERPEETILFVEVDPVSGEPVHPPDFPPVPMTPDRVASFGLADTPANQVELAFVRFGDPLRPSELASAIEFALTCIDLRHEAPGALERAETILRRAATVHEGHEGALDLGPQLVLARVLEIDFRHEEAFQLYRSLIDQGQGSNPEVWARLGDLYATFRLHDKAEACYREALDRSGSSWMARWRYGEFLLERGRSAEALVHLTEAERREPSGVEARRFRVGIRTALGHALLAEGRVGDAGEAFRRAISADPDDQAAVAGLLSTARVAADEALRTQAVEAMGGLEEQGGGATFELLLARGLDAATQGDWLGARRELELAAQADPFRAGLALRCLSWLAERTGNDDQALSLVEAAWQVDPTDPWTLYQRGRLLAQADDLEGAQASLRDALDQELDFAEALIAMARLAQVAGRHADAERYYERALSLDDARPRVASLRGFNLLALDDVEAAEQSFRLALRHDGTLASAHNGLAWCAYLLGDSEEAMTLFGELAERLRDPSDPHRQYAEAQVERIVDHEQKEVWTDRFERAAGSIGNGWSYELGFGPEVNLEEGAVRLSGTFSEDGRVRLYRELDVDAFLSFEASLTVERTTRARVGLFVSRETSSRSGGNRVLARTDLGRVFSPAGTEPVQVVSTRQSSSEQDTRDLFTATWRPGEPMDLAIVRRGEGSDAVLDLYVAGERVYEGLPMARLFTGTTGLRFGVFVEGDAGRTCDVRFDDVRVVRRKR